MFSFLRKDPRRPLIARLYRQVADAARQPALYRELRVPDTVEGRFEALILHMVIVLRALRRLPPPADEVAKDLTDAFFAALDASLREMGVGDITVPKRMRKLAEAFFGRARAYDGALDAADRAALAAALGRNVYGGEVHGGEAPPEALARYVLAADRALAGVDLEAMLGKGPHFPQAGPFAKEG